MDAVGGNGDEKGAFGAFGEGWASRFLVVLGGVGIGDLHLAGAEDLEPVVEVRSRCNALGAEAGAGVFNLNDAERCRGAVRDGGFNVCGMATGKGKP